MDTKVLKVQKVLYPLTPLRSVHTGMLQELPNGIPRAPKSAFVGTKIRRTAKEIIYVHTSEKLSSNEIMYIQDEMISFD